MCSLYGIHGARAAYLEYFAAIDDRSSALTIQNQYVSPGMPGYVVREEGGQRALSVMLLGASVNDTLSPAIRNHVAPFWAKVLAKPAQRCLVPVTRFRVEQRTDKREHHWFHVHSQPIFAFAGVWGSTGSERIFSFLTTGHSDDPTAYTVGIAHPNARPIIVRPEDHERWLKANFSDALTLGGPYPAQPIHRSARSKGGGGR